MNRAATQDIRQVHPAWPAARRAARLRPLSAPGGIAVIGASRDPAEPGAATTRSLAGFPGVNGLVALDAVVTFRDHAALEETDHHA